MSDFKKVSADKDDDQVIGSVRGREERFGADEMRAMVKRLLVRAGLTRFTGHNLKNTFATLVERKAGDLTVVMALIRDKVPGVASGYMTRDLTALLEDLLLATAGRKRALP